MTDEQPRFHGGIRTDTGFTPQCPEYVTVQDYGGPRLCQCIWQPGHGGPHRYERREFIEWRQGND